MVFTFPFSSAIAPQTGSPLEFSMYKNDVPLDSIPIIKRVLSLLSHILSKLPLLFTAKLADGTMFSDCALFGEFMKSET